MKTPHVSICVPTYCQVEFLRKTLRSVQMQDFSDYELIISDDSPDDSVGGLVRSFNFDGRMHYHRNLVPLGSPENWNAAVRLATGDYIKILHHDDKFAHAGALGEYVRMLDGHPEADFAFGASYVETSTRWKNRIHRPSKAQLAMLATSPEELFLGNAIGAPSATIYRNKLGIEYDPRMKWLVDIDLYIRVLQQNRHFVYTPEVLIVTVSGANHQVTKICENDARIELTEYMLLFQKIRDKLKNEFSTQSAWFRLFDKYRIRSQKDLSELGIDYVPIKDDFLQQIFIKYKENWLRRIPYRIYIRLPESLKASINYMRRLCF